MVQLNFDVWQSEKTEDDLGDPTGALSNGIFARVYSAIQRRRIRICMRVY